VLGRHADSNLVFDVRLTGLFPDELDLDLDEVERALAASFLRFRLRNQSIPASPEGTPPPPDTVLVPSPAISRIRSPNSRRPPAPPPAPLRRLVRRRRAGFCRADLDSNEELADLREVLRLGRHLLEGRQVTL